MVYLKVHLKAVLLGWLSFTTLSPTNAFLLPSTMINVYSMEGQGKSDFHPNVGNSTPRQKETNVCAERRQFLHSLILPTTAFLSQASVLLNNPVVTAALELDNMGGFTANIAMNGSRNKIRLVGDILDELQRDLMEERWDLVKDYPEQLRTFVPAFTKYTDSMFSTDSPSDEDLRVALRYEVGRFFASVVRLKQATTRRSLDEAYVAFADMSLHFDQYLHVGGLYTYYDAIIPNEDISKGSSDSIVYADQKKDAPSVKDLVVLIKGPDMGRTGTVIGIYLDDSSNCVVKLDRYKGFREIKVVPLKWVGKRLGEQDPDDVFLIPREA